MIGSASGRPEAQQIFKSFALFTFYSLNLQCHVLNRTHEAALLCGLYRNRALGGHRMIHAMTSEAVE